MCARYVCQTKLKRDTNGMTSAQHCSHISEGLIKRDIVNRPIIFIQTLKFKFETSTKATNTKMKLNDPFIDEWF